MRWTINITENRTQDILRRKVYFLFHLHQDETGKKSDFCMVTSSHRPAGFINRHVSPTLSPQPSCPHSLRRCRSSVFLPLPQDKPSVCLKHTRWLIPSCFTYTFLFSPLLEHHWTLQREVPSSAEQPLL